MIFLMFLALSQTSFSEEKKADVIIGGSIFKEKEEGKNAEYVRGAICYLNKVIDSDPNIIPKAIFYDNGNRPTRDLSNTRRLIFSDKASVLMGYSNMEGVLKSIEEAKKKDVVMAFPFVSLSQKDIDENSEDIFYLRPSIEKDLEALADFVNRHDVQKLAIVFEKEEEWQKEYISELTKIVPSVFSYIKDPLSMNEALMDIKQLKPSHIIILGEQKGAISFIKRAKFNGVDSTFILPFYLSNSEVNKKIKKYGVKVYSGKIFPNINSNNKTVKDYVKCSRKYEPDFEVGESGLEGFITAKILYSIIINSNMKDRKSMLESFKKIDLSSIIKLRVEECE
tara:strand:+ start:2360 stop:3373 length:1014 start_codon:yes stop_codon:yes gene_type:complete